MRGVRVLGLGAFICACLCVYVRACVILSVYVFHNIFSLSLLDFLSDSGIVSISKSGF